MSFGSNTFPSTSSGISDDDMIYRFSSGNKKSAGFANPYFDLASQYMPRNVKDLFKWVEYIYLANGVVAQCVERVVKYPITDLQFEEDEEEIVQKWETIFNDILKLKSFISDVGIDRQNYGNSFVSVFFPFNRILKCPKCKLETPIEKVIKLTFKDFKFNGVCRCGYKGTFSFMDRRSLDMKRINLIRWNPKHIDISFNPITGQYKYYYTVPPEIMGRVKAGDLNLVAELPKIFLESIQKKKIIKLSNDFIFHLKTSSLAGLNQEWGIPPTFRTFKLHYYNSILRRANEAIAKDYLLPIRVMFPDSRGMNNPSEFLNMRKYKDSALSMIKKHRQDPADAYFFPMPLGYQAVGAEMKGLNVDTEIKLANEEIMNSMGFPQELFYGSLSIQAAPVALRLLENTLSGWIDGMNSLTQWVANKIAIYFDLPKVSLSWMKVSLVDDLDRKQLLMQLVGAQKIADDTFLSTLGTSSSEEIKKRFKQMKIEMEEQKKFDERAAHLVDVQNQEQGAGATPQDLTAQAQQVAERWLNMDYSSRRREMNALSKQDENLYSLAKEVMTRMRSQNQRAEDPGVSG